MSQDLRSLGDLNDPDYCDTFTGAVRDSRSRSPEQWGRAMMTSPAMQRFVRVVQRGLLGMRLEPPSSPDQIFGWRIADRGENWFRIETDSWLLLAHLVVRVDHAQGSLSAAVFIRYERSLARFIWRPLSLLHRQVGLALMRNAMRAP